MMRDLFIEEYDFVAGGADWSVGDTMAVGTGLGGGVGLGMAAGRGLGGVASLTAAGLGAGWFGGVTAAALAGWKAGQFLNENTPIQSWIAKGLEWVDQTVDGDSE
ncbi:hypothetical protein [Roseateles sp. MS654]|uniref:hypothetical protein n=1 Tax=Roseateles sp. MS654 TaxID=3412685 RepID=UPI003C2E0E1D